MSLFQAYGGSAAEKFPSAPRPKGRGHTSWWVVLAALGLLALVLLMPGLSKLPATEQTIAAVAEGDEEWASFDPFNAGQPAFVLSEEEKERRRAVVMSTPLVDPYDLPGGIDLASLIASGRASCNVDVSSVIDGDSKTWLEEGFTLKFDPPIHATKIHLAVAGGGQKRLTVNRAMSLCVTEGVQTLVVDSKIESLQVELPEAHCLMVPDCIVGISVER